MSAIATVIDADEPEEIENIINEIPDLAGTFYRVSVPAGMIRRKIMKELVI